MVCMKKMACLVILACLALWCGQVNAASISGSAGMATMQDGPNAEGLFFTINVHYEAFDGKDATDPLGITPGKIQFAYILEYAAGNEYMGRFDLESTNGVPLGETGTSTNGTVNGITAGDMEPIGHGIIPVASGNPAARFLFNEDGDAYFGKVGSRSVILAFTVNSEYGVGSILGSCTDTSLTDTAEVSGPKQAPTLGVIQGNVICVNCGATGQILPMEGVTIKTLGSDGNTVASAVSGKDGQYVITGINTGDYMVAVDATSAFATCAVKTLAVTVGSDEPAIANFCVCPATCSQQVSVRVVYDQNNASVPVPQTFVGITGPEIKNRWARTKADGTVLFKGKNMAVGHYTVAIKAPKGYEISGAATTEFDLATCQSKSLTFKIKPVPPCTQNICVKVVKADDGNSTAPIPGVKITAACTNAMSGTTDNNGQVCFAVKTGQHVVTITVPEGYRLDGDKSVRFCLSRCEQKDVTFTLYAIKLGPCPQMPTYWKQHPGTWPISSMYVGADILTQQQLMNILSGKLANGGKASSDDISLKLAQNLIAVNLSIAAGSDPQDIGPVVVATDEFFLYDYPPGSGPTGRGKDMAKDLNNKLVDYLKDRCYCIGQ